MERNETIAHTVINAEQVLGVEWCLMTSLTEAKIQ